MGVGYGARPSSTSSLQNRIIATDILCPMYGQISDLITLANRYPDHPLILSEYSLMTCDSGGNIEEDWNSFNGYRRLQGGFLSNWVDHEIFIDSQSSFNGDLSQWNVASFEVWEDDEDSF
jgi:beta-galactosidase/beta-glucuronidase